MGKGEHKGDRVHGCSDECTYSRETGSLEREQKAGFLW